MKVAVIGAGFAGITCALQLERLGVNPDLYERNEHIIEPFRHVGGELQIVFRPVRDPFQYLNSTYDLDLRPSGLIKRITHIGPTARAEITGKLGWFFHKGYMSGSIDDQLARKLKCRIFLQTEVDYKEIKNDYDYIVIASGTPFEAKELGVWQDLVTMSIKGVVVSGNFDTDTFKVWINKEYCKSGYAYLAPFNKKEAILVLVVDNIELTDIDKYWNRFVNAENIHYNEEEVFKRNHYAGIMLSHQVGNIFFIGNAGGSLNSLFGTGIYPTVVTASEAAKSIVCGTNYESAIQNVMKLNIKLLEFRKTINLLDNKGYDALIKLVGLPGVNSLIYRSRIINAVNLGHYALKPINAILRMRNKLPLK